MNECLGKVLSFQNCIGFKGFSLLQDSKLRCTWILTLYLLAIENFERDDGVFIDLGKASNEVLRQLISWTLERKMHP